MMNVVDERLTGLMADDDPNDLILLRRVFDRIPCMARLLTVSNGEEVLAYLQGEGKYHDRQEHPFPDILFLDYRMPRLSGLAVLCWLRSDVQFERIPVVILSSTYSAAQSEMAARMSAASCPKKISNSNMAELIVESIRTARRLVRHSGSAHVDATSHEYLTASKR